MRKVKVLERSHRSQIDKWLKTRKQPLATRLRDVNPDSLWDIEAEDTVIVRNDYGVRIQTTVVGFGKSGEIYLDWDCYWFPIRETYIEKVIKSKK